jgi:hypothetical protein
VAFDSFARTFFPDSFGDVYVRDRQRRTTEVASVGLGGVYGDDSSGISGLAVSTDGRFVAFDSYADNLVPGDTNGVPDVFVRDRERRATQRVNVGPGGRQANGFTAGSFMGRIGMSADGRAVAFDSFASNLVPGDTDNASDVFVHAR